MTARTSRPLAAWVALSCALPLSACTSTTRAGYSRQATLRWEVRTGESPRALRAIWADALASVAASSHVRDFLADPFDGVDVRIEVEPPPRRWSPDDFMAPAGCREVVVRVRDRRPPAVHAVGDGRVILSRELELGFASSGLWAVESDRLITELVDGAGPRPHDVMLYLTQEYWHPELQAFLLALEGHVATVLSSADCEVLHTTHTAEGPELTGVAELARFLEACAKALRRRARWTAKRPVQR